MSIKSKLHEFHISAGARLSCIVDFMNGNVLNIDFYDAARTTIPFHLSLRRDEHLVVLNRRDLLGWRREIPIHFEFAPRAIAVDIRFKLGRVELRVDHQSLGSFDALPRPAKGGRLGLRRGFPHLSRIAAVGFEGAMKPGSLLLTCPKLPLPATDFPLLNDALELLLGGFTQAAQAGMRAAYVQVEGLADPIPATLRALPYALGGMDTRAHALTAVLPGRIWRGGANSLQLTLMREAGAELATLRITRDEVRARIEHMAASGGLETDDRAALQAIEHAHHAALLPDLSHKAREGLGAVAERFKLTDYLLAGAAQATSTTPPAATAPNPVDAARDAFTQAMRQAPEGDPVALLRRIIAARALSPPNLDLLLLSLVEWFCIHGGVYHLAQLRRDLGCNDLPEPAAGDAWRLSSSLPLYYAEGRFAEIAQALQILTPPNGEWIVTPALGWIARQIAMSAPDLQGGLLPFAPCHAILQALCAWADARAPLYWERTQCQQLIKGMVALLAHNQSFARSQRLTLIWMSARVYGLSPVFWREVAQAPDDLPLPPVLQAARDGFAALRKALAGSAPLDQAGRLALQPHLACFQTLGAADYLRFRRDLLGPSGQLLAEDALPDACGSLASGLDPDEALLRHLVFPRVAPLPEDHLHRQVGHLRRGVAAAYVQVPRAAFRDAEAAALTEAAALLRHPDPARMTRLQELLVPLTSAPARFVGLGLGLNLARGLLAQQRENEAATLLAHGLAICDALADPDEHLALLKATAPTQALAALQADHPEHPLTRSALAALSGRLRASIATPDADQTADLRAKSNPLFDVVVCIYTCQRNLPTRVATIRETWLQELTALGVPWLIFVGGGDGGGDGRREGDVVYLDAPDDYEALPQKTLAMVEWVRRHTGFGHLFKVDDDCFVHAEALFGDLALQSFDYYGRTLTRRRGSMDRTWHMAKSRSARGRLELDKSPEPSRYCDGGSGYALSRRAMLALGEAAQSAAGRELIQLSFMEDKLVGDLLALNGISPVSEEYRTCLLRRSAPDGPLLARWDNGLLPFANSGIKLAHLDGAERQAEVLEASRKPWPKAAKIWPSYQPAQLGWRSNTLDLISTPETLAQVNEAEVAVVACLRNEMFILPQFLAHYRGLGVRGFLIADNGSDDGSFEFLAAQPDVALFAVDTDYRASHYGVAWQQALLSNFRVGRWSLVADADEFLFASLDRDDNLPEITRGFDVEGATAARIFMLDMYPQGPLSDADFASGDPFAQAGFVDRDPFLKVWGGRGPFSDSPVWTSALRHRLIPGSRADLFVAQKYALLKYMPWMRLSAGLHFVANLDLAQREVFFAHFKYNAAFHAKAQAEVTRKQHFNNAEEYRKYLALASEGRDVVYDPALSLRWDQAEFLRRRLSAGGAASRVRKVSR